MTSREEVLASMEKEMRARLQPALDAYIKLACTETLQTLEKVSAEETDRCIELVQLVHDTIGAKLEGKDRTAATGALAIAIDHLRDWKNRARE